MSFELTTDEAFLVYAAIADHAWDSDLGKLATRIYNNYHSQPAPDWLFPTVQDCVLRLIPNAQPCGLVATDNECYFETQVQPEDLAKGKKWTTKNMITPLLTAVIKEYRRVYPEPTHYSIAITPQGGGYHILVMFFST